MKNKNKLYSKIHIMSAREKTLHDMPKFNPYQTGHGVWGDTKYNRSKNKRQSIKIIAEQMNIVCDSCNATIEGTYASSVFGERIRTKAIKAGWAVTDHEILCPRCAKLRKKESKE